MKKIDIESEILFILISIFIKANKNNSNNEDSSIQEEEEDTFSSNQSSRKTTQLSTSNDDDEELMSQTDTESISCFNNKNMNIEEKVSFHNSNLAYCDLYLNFSMSKLKIEAASFFVDNLNHKKLLWIPGYGLVRNN